MILVFLPGPCLSKLLNATFNFCPSFLDSLAGPYLNFLFLTEKDLILLKCWGAL